MPIYEYRCTSCGDVFEKIQKFSDPPLSSCESCNGTVEKLISRAAFHLKGGGWYTSGYSRSSGDAPAAEGTKSGSNGESGKTSTSGTNGESKSSGGGCGPACACH